MKPVERLRMIRKIKLSIDDSKIVKNDFQDDGLEGSCWEGYEPIGMKEKDGKMVPNACQYKPRRLNKVSLFQVQVVMKMNNHMLVDV